MFFFDELDNACIPVAYIKQRGNDSNPIIYIDEIKSPLNSFNFKLPNVGSQIQLMADDSIKKFLDNVKIIGTVGLGEFDEDHGHQYYVISFNLIGTEMQFVQNYARTEYILQTS